jgi:hypothetical protein
MKHRVLVQFAVILMVALLSANKLAAQITPKKLVFVAPVGSAPPPVAHSSVFKVPVGVAIGVSSSSGVAGIIYVADPDNNQVVVFPPGGSTTTFSALPCPNSVTGCVLNPWPLKAPTFVATAPHGNIWISDTGNDVVVEVDPAGTVVAFAGNGPSNVVCGGSCSPNPNAGQGNGQFFGPGPLAVDALGNLYVADAAGDVLLNTPAPGGNFRIQKFASNGAFTTTWGSFCRLNADGTQAVGSCNTLAPGAVALGDGQVALVTGLAVDNVPNVYVAEEGNNRVQKFNAVGTFLLKWGGLPVGSADGQFNAPGGVAVDFDQSVYVVDNLNDRVQVFDGSGHFVSKGGSKGTAEAQFNAPFGIATVPPPITLTCALAFDPTLSDCVHGFFVSEYGPQGNTRVQQMAGRPDTDNDGITDEIDIQPTVPSTNFGNAPLGFTTSGSIVSPGDQTFAIYNLFTPSSTNEIRIRTESFGGDAPLTVSLCGAVTLSFSAGTGVNMHCSTPTVVAEYGPVGFQFTGTDGTLATGTLNTGDSVTFNPQASIIQSNVGNIVVVIGGKSILLAPGQTGFADSTPPTTLATVSPSPNANQWNNTNVVVSLNATDNPGGSGVNAITYSLTGAQPGSGSMAGSTASVPISTEGITTLNFFASDNAGNRESGKSLVVRIDKTPPNLMCSASPAILWPPNHQLVPVTVSVTVNDTISGPGNFVLTSVTNNQSQPNNDGSNDIQGFTVGTASTRGLLRAERGQTARVYTLIYSGTDLAGNQGSCTVNITVPHSNQDH